jgi:hypothetical protein
MADDPARITIKAAETARSPRAIAVIGGPNGAPGQDATMRNPAATMGWAWSRSNRPTATAGTPTYYPGK